MISLFVSPSCSTFEKMVNFKVWMIVNGVQFNHITVDPEKDPTAFCEACKGSDRIVIVGGIRTINIIVRATRSLDIPYAIIPPRRYSDFPKALGMNKMPDEELFKLITSGPVKDIDIWSANGKIFISSLTIGASTFAGNIRSDGDDPKYLEPLKKPFAPANFKVNGTDLGELTFFSVQNIPTIGGGLVINPASKCDDGVLDAVALKKTNFIRSFLNKKSLDSDGLTSQSNASVTSAGKFSVECGRSELCLIDGIGYDFDRVEIVSAGKIPFVSNN